MVWGGPLIRSEDGAGHLAALRLLRTATHSAYPAWTTGVRWSWDFR